MIHVVIINSAMSPLIDLKVNVLKCFDNFDVPRRGNFHVLGCPTGLGPDTPGKWGLGCSSTVPMRYV